MARLKEGREKASIFLKPEVWENYKQLCSILDKIPSREIEKFMLNELLKAHKILENMKVNSNLKER